MKHEYQNLMRNISVPEDLNQRVLSAARQETPQRKQNIRKPVWRAAVCAVLALMLAVGGVTLRPSGDPKQLDRRIFREDSPAVLPQLTYEFALTAYAADTLPAANGNLVLGGGESGTVITTTELIPEREQYTKYRFRIHGEQIVSLTMTMDRGGLYRVKDGQSMMNVLENPAEEPYDPETVYGLWVPPAEFVQGQGTAVLDGAHLTVTARFTDGTEQTNTYRLTVQRLQVSCNEDGTELLVPALEGSEGGSISGLYLESLNSVWLRWPVEGSNTVSLSNRYGFRVVPGGQRSIFHSGIDIPAEQDTPVLAAAGGTVTEHGFDTARGNYLILDHGGGMETVYAHCRSLSVETGAAVAAGQEIAAVGATGMATGPHLHFEVRQDGEAQNPVAYFDAETRDTLKME